jgi:hypothetical protein
MHDPSELLKEFDMPKYTRLVTAFAAIAACATVAPVRAQQDVRLVAHVPFAFSVGDATLPSDTYRLSRMNEHRDVLLLRGDRTGAIVRASEVNLARTNASPSLLFHRYGDQYFLREIRWEDTARLDLPQTRQERRAAERRADLAATAMETVIIAVDQQ